MSVAASLPRIGISAIGIHEPSWVLHNDWFHGILPTKFVQHTGIESRRVSWDDEVTMAVRAVEDLCRQSGCRLHDCAGLVFTASSLMPASVGRKYLGEEHARRAGLGHAAGQFRKRLGLPAVPVVAINWGCSGYPKALATVRRRLLKAVPLRRSQFLLAVTVNRTSKILDYACRQTAGLFGDFAQATLLARCDSRRYPVHFELLLAAAETCPAEGVFFDYHPRENVLVPTIEGGRRAAPQRLVFSLNGMGIGDAAPRAMAAVAEKALRAARIDPKRIRFVIPHQAGAGIVRLAAMRLAELGIRGEVINGLTRDVANISSSSVPYAIKREWDRLRGIILCPTAGVGNPGDRSVTQGCLILKTTRAHRLAVARRAALRRAS